MRPLTALLLLTSVLCGCGGSGGGGGGGAVFIAPVPTQATPDAAFSGGSGVFVYDVEQSIGKAAAIDSSGRIVIVGVISNAGNLDIAVWRLLDDGTLDTTFGTDGMVVSAGAAGGMGADSGEDVAIDSSGRIIVCGWSTNIGGTTDVVLLRLLENGDFDISFGTGGVALYDTTLAGADSDDRPTHLSQTDAGLWLVTGSTFEGTSNDGRAAVWRFLAGGGADLTFGSAGVALSSTDTDRGVAAYSDPMDLVLVSGNRGGDLALWGYEADGDPLLAFGVAGEVLFTPGVASTMTLNDSALDAAFATTTVGSQTDAPFDSQLVVVRIANTGLLDQAFNTSGRLLYGSEHGPTDGFGIHLPGDGNTWVAGCTSILDINDDVRSVATAWVFLPMGGYDTNVGTNGVIHMAGLSTLTELSSEALDLTLDSSDRPVLTGSIQTATGTFMAVWRVTP